MVIPERRPTPSRCGCPCMKSWLGEPDRLDHAAVPDAERRPPRKGNVAPDWLQHFSLASTSSAVVSGLESRLQPVRRPGPAEAGTPTPAAEIRASVRKNALE